MRRSDSLSTIRLVCAYRYYSSGSDCLWPGTIVASSYTLDLTNPPCPEFHSNSTYSIPISTPRFAPSAETSSSPILGLTYQTWRGETRSPISRGYRAWFGFQRLQLFSFSEWPNDTGIRLRTTVECKYPPLCSDLLRIRDIVKTFQSRHIFGYTV